MSWAILNEETGMVDGWYTPKEHARSQCAWYQAERPDLRFRLVRWGGRDSDHCRAQINGIPAIDRLISLTPWAHGCKEEHAGNCKLWSAPRTKDAPKVHRGAGANAPNAPPTLKGGAWCGASCGACGVEVVNNYKLDSIRARETKAFIESLKKADG